MLWIALVAGLGIVGWLAWLAPRLVALLLMTFITIALGGSALALLLPGEFVLGMIWVGLTLPIAWVLLLLWCYADNHRWRPFFGMIAMSVVAGILLLVLEPGV